MSGEKEDKKKGQKYERYNPMLDEGDSKETKKTSSYDASRNNPEEAIMKASKMSAMCKNNYKYAYITPAFKLRKTYAIDQKGYATAALQRLGVQSPTPKQVTDYVHRYRARMLYDEEGFNMIHQLLKRHLFRVRYNVSVDCYAYKVSCFHALVTDWLAANNCDIFGDPYNHPKRPVKHNNLLFYPPFIASFFWNLVANEADTKIDWQRFVTQFRTKEVTYFSNQFIYTIRGGVSIGLEVDYDYVNMRFLKREDLTHPGRFVSDPDTYTDFNLANQPKALAVVEEINQFFALNHETWGVYRLPVFSEVDRPEGLEGSTMHWDFEQYRKPTEKALAGTAADLASLLNHAPPLLINQALLGKHGMPLGLEAIEIAEQLIVSKDLMIDPTKLFFLERLKSGKDAIAEFMMPSKRTKEVELDFGEETEELLKQRQSITVSSSGKKKVHTTVDKKSKMEEEHASEDSHSYATEGEGSLVESDDDSRQLDRSVVVEKVKEVAKTPNKDVKEKKKADSSKKGEPAKKADKKKAEGDKKHRKKSEKKDAEGNPIPKGQKKPRVKLEIEQDEE